MKKVIKRVVASLLIAAVLIGICPVATNESKAATKSVTLANLGTLGTLTVGKKTKSGNWWMMKMGNNKAFCMDLGYTCHTGDVYSDSTTSFSSSDTGKKGLKADIGYWYNNTMNESRKAYVLAQALFWAVEEGDTSEEELKDVIKTVKNNTNYFSKTANQLYKQIFENEDTFVVNATEWTYAGSSSHRQRLLMIDSNKIEPDHISVNDLYRQRIRIKKVNENGNPMSGAKFVIEAKNIDELYSYRINGTTTDAEEDIQDFSIETETDTNGWINLRLTYRLQTNDYFYLNEDDLNSMSSSDKKALKEEWDEMGYGYAANLTYAGAKEKMETELLEQLNDISNKYVITETDSGNVNISINSDYAKGKTITVDKYWTRGYGVAQQEWSEVIESPYDLEIVDKYKKVALSVKKVDGYSSDKKAHGNATLDGAEFGIYEDAACTDKADFISADGKAVNDNIFEIKNGTFETPYLRCGQTYYLKELRAPEGYKLSTDIKKIVLDGSKYSNTVEYVPTKESITVENQPILGKVALQKFYGEGKTGQIHPEVGAVFQVYLDSKGSYAACSDYERDTLTIDENGYACSKDLYYGVYRIHQISSGDKDTEFIDDIYPVVVTGEKNTQTFTMQDVLFKAYLRIIKKDGNTQKDVLKAGTAYQIYQVDENGKETLVTQEYSDGHKKNVIDTFTTDESGQIMTVEPLLSATYRIYEIDAATGYHISTPYIEVTINSKNDNYEKYTDNDGSTYSVVTTEYVNYEAYGKLSLLKKGEQLVGYKDGDFIYEEKQLDNVVFDIYADGDIVTQDNQGTTWFKDGEKVATITTGKDVVFESKCGGITGYEMNKDGLITLNLPLGKYRVVEKETPYGYVLPEKEWKVEFTWENKESTYVLNTTDATDEKGVMNVWNERAKASIQLKKTDQNRNIGIKNVVFGLYTKNDIYNAEGKKIVDAGTRLGSLVTDSSGNATSDVDLPLMSEKYSKEIDVTSGSAITVTGATVSNAEGLNSGDYYLKEETVPGSYYLDDTMIPLHLEYKDMNTPVISQNVKRTNLQTVVQIDKKSVVNSEEIPGCELVISDTNGKEIITWTSGNKDSVVLHPFLEQMGYSNVTYQMDEKGNLIVNGLLHGVEYVLTEKRPADGYVTADSISFKLGAGENMNETIVALKNETGVFVYQSDHVVTMVDEITKIQFKKQNENGVLLGGAKIAVYDSNGKKITEFTTKEGQATKFEGLFIVGETYTFKEVKAPDGYDLAKDVRYTIRDTKEIQTVKMTDKKLGFIKTKTSKDFSEKSDDNTSPKTGYTDIILMLMSIMFFGSGVSIFAWRRYYAKKKIAK